MKYNRYLILSFIFFILVGFTQYKYDSSRNYFRKQNTFLTLPSGQTLKILSFGNSELLADMLYIWSIQFYSNYNILNSKDFIEDIYNLITDISPEYKDPYLLGSTIMAIELHEIDMAVRLLQKGAKNMENEWIFDFESGYYTSKYLKNYDLAEKFYKKASQKKDAPKFLSRMFYHTVYMKGDLEEAWKLYLNILKNATSEVERHSANLHLYQIKFEMDKKKIENALFIFKKRYGFFPDSINDLSVYGIIGRVPKDFKGNDYKYNKKKGTIIPKEGYMWKKQY